MDIQAHGSRERIVRAAARLFHERGYCASGLDAILEAAEVSRSNLYYHFPSKQAVCLAVIEREIEAHLNGRLRPILEDMGLTPRERLRRIFVQVADEMETMGCRRGSLFGNLALELSDMNDACRRTLAAYFDGLADVLWPVVAQAQAVGQLRDSPDARTLSEMLIAQMEGAMLLAKAQRSTRLLHVCLMGFLELAAPEDETAQSEP